jgi:hypothetical protein
MTIIEGNPNTGYLRLLLTPLNEPAIRELGRVKQSIDELVASQKPKPVDPFLALGNVIRH